MLAIQRAKQKPNRILINYNTVRAAELKAINDSIVSDTEVQTIKNGFGFSDDDNENIDECVDFLNAVDFLDRDGDDRVVTPINRDVFPDLSFEARLLHHLRCQEGDQDHLGRIQDVALRSANRSLNMDSLLAEVNSELSDYEFDWNDTKLRMWKNLAVQVGLISETKSRGVVLSPSRALVYDLLVSHREQEASDDFYSALEWIEENFFSVFRTRTGTPEVHPAVSDVLQNLENDGSVVLRGMADAQDEVKLPESNHHPNTRKIKEYQIEDSRSDATDYQYPLSKFNLVVNS